MLEVKLGERFFFGFRESWLFSITHLQCCYFLSSPPHPHPRSGFALLSSHLWKMATTDIEAGQVYRRLVDRLLDHAVQVKADGQIEPPLTEAHLGDAIWQVPEEDEGIVKALSQQTQYAAVEIAFREKFYRVLVGAHRIRLHEPVMKGLLLTIDQSQRPLPQSRTLHSSKYGISSTSSPYSPTTVSHPTPQAHQPFVL